MSLPKVISMPASAPSSATPSGPAGGDLSGTYPNPSVVDDSHNHTVSTVTDFTENLQDGVAALVQNGTGITWSYNDGLGTLTPTVTITQYTDEMAQDAVGAMVDSSLVYVDATPLLTRAALTGDVTAAQGSNSTTIANDAVTYAKMQNVSATSRVLGRITAGAGDVEELTAANLVTIVNSSLDHGTLTGLADDDHTQYVKLAGRGSAQTIYGGVTEGDSLNISGSPAALGYTNIGVGGKEYVSINTSGESNGLTVGIHGVQNTPTAVFKISTAYSGSQFTIVDDAATVIYEVIPASLAFVIDQNAQGYNLGIGTSSFGSAGNCLALKLFTAPSSSVTDVSQVYTADRLGVAGKAWTHIMVEEGTSGSLGIVVAQVDLVTQSAAITATTLYAVPAGCSGIYKVDWVATVTRAATTSSVLGGTNGFQVDYTDADDSVVKTTPGTVTAGVGNNATNSTATGTITGSYTVFAKASTNIQYLMGYTSVGATSMQYNLHIVCTRI